MSKIQSNKTLKITMLGLMTAMCYIGFALLKFDIPVGPYKTAIHFGNAFCVLTALLLGGLYGGIAGAVGMGLADLTSGYVTSAPMTVVLKLIMGILCGVIFSLCSKKFKINKTVSSIIATVFAMGMNILLDPILRFLYNQFVMGAEQSVAGLLAKFSSVTTAINSLTSVIISVLLYSLLSKALEKIK